MAKADVMAGRAFVSLFVKQDALTRGLQKARANVDKFGSDLMGFGTKLAGIGSLMAVPLAASVRVAANFEEAISKFNFVFKDAKDSAKDWADGFAKQVGRSRLQVVEFLADTQALVMPIGFEDGAAVEMSKQLTTLAVDLASFNNSADSDVLRDLHSALVGSSETMLKYGVIANEAAVKQELLNMAINPKDATNQDKVLARYNIIMRGTVAAQGDATRTSQSFTNQMKALNGSLSDMAVEVGTAVLPALSKIAANFVAIIRPLAEIARQNPEVVMSFAAVSVAVVASGVAIYGFGIAAKVAAVGVGVLITGVGIIKSVFGLAMGGVRLFQAATVGLATFMQATFAGAATASAVAVTALATAETASAGMAAPFTAATVIAANATGLLGFNAAATSVAMLAQANAMGLILIAAGAASGGLITMAGSEVAASGGLITMGASSVGASSGLLLMAGSAVTTAAGVTTAAVASTASAGIMSTVWTAAAGVISTAWAVMTAPIVPFLIAAAAIVAVVGLIAGAAAWATIKGTDFSGAWKVATGTLSEMMAVAKQVGGILMDALGGGDYDIAFQAAMQGIKLTLAVAIDAMSELWSLFWNGAWEMTKAFFTNFIGISGRMMGAVARAIANPTMAVTELLAAGYDLANQSFEVSFGIDTTGMRKEAKDELDRLEKELADRKSQREEEAKPKADQEAADKITGKTANDKFAKELKQLESLMSQGLISEEQFNKEKKRLESERAMAGGDQTQGPPDGASAATDAFDRETEAIQQQIIALTQGAEAAERFRLAKLVDDKGKAQFTPEQIDDVMLLQSQQQEATKAQEAAQREVQHIQDYADVDANRKEKTMTSAEIADKEKLSIEEGRKAGRIDNETAKKAMAEADVRQAERDHQASLKKFKGEGVGGTETGIKSGGASAATFSAQSLMQLGASQGKNTQLQAAVDTKKEIMAAKKQAKEDAEKQLEATKNQGLHHA
jgi:hypothetical protein